jgi:hypothetical protein
MIGPTDLLHPSPTPHFETFQVFLIYCPNRPSFSTIQSRAIHYDCEIIVIWTKFVSYNMLGRERPSSSKADIRKILRINSVQVKFALEETMKGLGGVDV